MNDWEKRFQDIIDEVHNKSQEEQKMSNQASVNEASNNQPNGNTEYQYKGETYAYGDAAQFRKDYSANTNAEETKKEKKSGSFITKKAFVITLICAMVFSLAVGGAGSYFIAKSVAPVVNESTSVIYANNFTLADATKSKLSIQEIAALNEASVVAITTEQVSSSYSWFGSYTVSGAGSGVIYSEDGYVLTNNHVISGATSITVTLYDGTEYPATVVASDSVCDVAVVKIDATGLTPVKFASNDDIAVGDLAVVIGNPLGTLSGSVTEGIISSKSRDVTIDGQKMTLIQTSAAVNPGNSGGGLFNDEGKLIGLIVAKSSSSGSYSQASVEGIGWAIPCDTVAKVAESLIANGYVAGRPQIGITLLDLTSPFTAMQYGVSMTGIYIKDVTSDNAKNAGLQPGDLIYMVDKTQISSSSQLTSIVQSHEVGDKITLTVVRNDKMLDVTVVLSEATK